jgi:hypothetical protein
MFAFILLSFVCSLSFLWSIPFLISSYFGWRVYEVKEIDKVMLISSKIVLSSMKNDDSKPRGIFVGYYYVGVFIDNKDSEPHIYMIAHENSFKTMIRRNALPNHEETDVINYFERSCNFHWLRYSNRKCSLRFQPLEKQTYIIDNIVETYQKTHYCVSFIQGDPGSGKSMTSLLLCKKMSGSLVRTFNPCEPGDTISSLYNQVNPTIASPLIVVLDEFDILLHKLHNSLIEPHRNISIQIYDKITWNRFFDDVNLGLYPYLIIILTSNYSHKQLEELYDPSYIREGRIHVNFHLD